ncbi:YciI family protein [soil metagenome]
MKYLLALSGVEAAPEGQPSPDEMAAMMQPWADYGQALSEAGAYVAGEGLQPSSTARSVDLQGGGEPIVTDGPFAETKEQLGGFYLLECPSIEDAVEWAKKVPGGGKVEVRPVMDFSEFGYESPGTEESS